MMIYDEDWGGRRQYVGMMHMELFSEDVIISRTAVASKEELPNPKWYPVYYRKAGDSHGEVLASFEICSLEANKPIPPPPR